MSRRSRRRSSTRKPAILVIALLVLLAGWFWQQQRTAPRPPVTAPVATEGQIRGATHTETALPLPALSSAGSSQAEVTRPTSAPIGDVGDTAQLPVLPAFLPPQARQTLQRIAQDGPHPYRQDGSVFGNREKRLPARPRGYYREYTVDTPGLNHRGARRIVTGGQPPHEYYYSDDHYESFRRFELPATQARP